MGQIRASTWWGVSAPAGTPAAQLDVLRRAFRESLADARVQDAFRQLGALPMQGVDMAQRMREDATYWEAEIRRLGVTAD